jgi:hypothetical protein
MGEQVSDQFFTLSNPARENVCTGYTIKDSQALRGNGVSKQSLPRARWAIKEETSPWPPPAREEVRVRVRKKDSFSKELLHIFQTNTAGKSEVPRSSYQTAHCTKSPLVCLISSTCTPAPIVPMFLPKPPLK